MVHLGTGPKAAEIRGTLSLGATALEFTPKRPGTGAALEYASIRLAKRIRGSPVLMVVWREHGTDRRTAFYFSQPPPLEGVPRSPTLDPPRGPLGPFTRATPSKRQVARMNLGYLRSASMRNRETVREWERAIRERATGAS
jgi:hypothetical protein